MNETIDETEHSEQTARYGPCGWHEGGHHHWRYRRRDLSKLSGPQRLAHHTGRFVSGLIFLAVKVTILVLIVAVMVSAWRWIFDVFS